MSNPLHVPLHLTHVALQYTATPPTSRNKQGGGGDSVADDRIVVEAEEVEVRLDGKQEAVVKLTLVPRSICSLKITGVRWKLGDRVDGWG